MKANQVVAWTRDQRGESLHELQRYQAGTTAL
jgi:hypothetical protein